MLSLPLKMFDDEKLNFIKQLQFATTLPYYSYQARVFLKESCVFQNQIALLENVVVIFYFVLRNMANLFVSTKA